MFIFRQPRKKTHVSLFRVSHSFCLSETLHPLPFYVNLRSNPPVDSRKTSQRAEVGREVRSLIPTSRGGEGEEAVQKNTWGMNKPLHQGKSRFGTGKACIALCCRPVVFPTFLGTVTVAMYKLTMGWQVSLKKAWFFATEVP